MFGNPIGETRKFWRLAADYVSDRIRSRAAVRELDALGPERSAEVLSGFSMTPSEFSAAMRLPFASEDLLAAAMGAIGLDSAAVEAGGPATYRDLCRSCMTCEHRLRCRSDLGQSTFAGKHQDYCPNGQRFLGLMGSRRSRLRRH